MCDLQFKECFQVFPAMTHYHKGWLVFNWEVLTQLIRKLLSSTNFVQTSAINVRVQFLSIKRTKVKLLGHQNSIARWFGMDKFVILVMFISRLWNNLKDNFHYTNFVFINMAVFRIFQKMPPQQNVTGTNSALDKITPRQNPPL